MGRAGTDGTQHQYDCSELGFPDPYQFAQLEYTITDGVLLGGKVSLGNGKICIMIVYLRYASFMCKEMRIETKNLMILQGKRIYNLYQTHLDTLAIYNCLSMNDENAHEEACNCVLFQRE